jgi:hypothetical protein
MVDVKQVQLSQGGGNRRFGTAFMLYGDRPLRHRWFFYRVHDLGGGNGFL